MRPTRGWLALALPLVLGTSGCATANAAWRAGPMGIAAEWTIRDHLMYGRADQAWIAMGDKKVAPRDALLRHMYRGVIALHAHEYAAGAKSMDRAWQIVEDRYTKRLSAGAMSLMTSDAALPYYPLATEHYFVPYYGALNWLAQGNLDETAVEARRLAMLLQAEGRKPARELEGALRYFTGVMFEAAGEYEDARVAYRNATALLGTLPGDTLRAGADSGDVVVIVEDGFVGRPQPQTLGIYTNSDELVGLTTGSDANRIIIANRVANRRYDPFNHDASLGWLTYEVNWATFGDPTPGPHPIEVRTNPRTFPLLQADVTGSVGGDFEREVPAKLARGIARAAVRYAAMRAAEGQIDRAINGDEDDEDKEDTRSQRIPRMLFGLLLGAFSVSSTVIDQPDLRAWQLLPHRLTIARVRLPVGEHPIEVLQGGVVHPLGTVTVRPGGVAVLTHRAWPRGGIGPTMAAR
ncbi:hypothetical protein Strain138_001215 [Pseudogemmatithrix spongiicola]|uniref:Tetratricopeptide repeat protein n=1 Tax=Pseudogemmatithrix spongiicola TaxID=3062599 RepID=A0AA49JU29_9BACT|nr:hypothetical protein Strain138_001215 [Gemmatimonadaceae bacterium 'strain 138']WKW14854.1 hypothetical protein Strain318_001215 [Gemmatimonadaceae bacterium 'strain 318']